MNCAALSEGLLESELFGHQRGAFTDATQTRVGAFEAAHGGTLFLDEIGELPPGVQSKLLRALDRREIRKVGSDAVHKVNVRVVAATNRNLRAEVNAGRFRPDLFYRLAVIETTLPPLRDRDGDLPLLVDHLLEAMGAADHPGAAAARTERFLAELARHAWPGNVRELRNYLERCLAVEDPEPPSAGPPARGERAAVVDASVPLRVARERWLRGFEEEYLRELLRRHGDNVSAAARAAGVDRVHLHRLLARAGLRGK